MARADARAAGRSCPAASRCRAADGAALAALLDDRRDPAHQIGMWIFVSITLAAVLALAAWELRWRVAIFRLPPDTPDDEVIDAALRRLSERGH